jgi:mannose-6-phosphate isomerase-like protein (cupin superfamily)
VSPASRSEVAALSVFERAHALDKVSVAATGLRHSRDPASRFLVQFSGVARHVRRVKPIEGHHLIKPEDLTWRLSNLMQIPNADILERTGSENLAARFWRLPPKSAGTLHKHIRQEEFYFVLEGTGRIRVGDETLTVPKHGSVLVGPEQLRQVFNDTDQDVLWLILGAPEELELLPTATNKPDLSVIYPVDPKQMPKELAGVEWPRAT